jgi:hypothetical protein
MSDYNYVYIPKDLRLTNEMKACLDYLMKNNRSAMNSLVNSEHFQFKVGLKENKRLTMNKFVNSEPEDTELTLCICFDLRDYRMSYNTIDTLILRCPSISRFNASGGEGSGKLHIGKIFTYKCEGFDNAFKSMQMIIPDLSEKSFSRLHPRLTDTTETYRGPNGLLHVKEQEIYSNKYTSTTICIANFEIIPNITAISDIIETVANIW